MEQNQRSCNQVLETHCCPLPNHFQLGTEVIKLGYMQTSKYSIDSSLDGDEAKANLTLEEASPPLDLSLKTIETEEYLYHLM